MVAVKSPLIGLQMDDQTALYIGVLERQVLALTVNELKFRALLELATGEEWDDMKTNFEEGAIRDIAVAIVQKKQNVSLGQARKIVKEREDAANN